jgi:hypothetical protein
MWAVTTALSCFTYGEGKQTGLMKLEGGQNKYFILFIPIDFETRG